MRLALIVIAATALILSIAAANPPGHAYGRRRTPTATSTMTATPSATSTVTPLPTETATPVVVTPTPSGRLPVRVVVVGFADHPVSPEAEAMVCGTWVPAIQQWWIANANRTFTFTCTSYTSPNPISSYGAQDDCGQGVDTRLFLTGIYSELGLNTGGLYNNQWRNWYIIIGGGGVAQTSAIASYPPGDTGDNHADVLVGDWHLTAALGTVDPCCPTHDIYGPEDCQLTGPRPLDQEALNSMSLGYYNTDTGMYWPDPIGAEGIAALQDATLNVQWLYAP